MVSGLSIIFMIITLFISLGFPLGLVVYFYRRDRISIKAVLVGALMFLLFQVVLRMPALAFLETQSWFVVFSAQNMLLKGLLLAFTAGLFETAGRYIGLKFLIRKNINRKSGIAYGIGHGGIEAILLVGLSYAVYLIYGLLINSGTVSSSVLPMLIEIPSYLFLLAGIERFFAILFHMAASLMVAYGIASKRRIYILYCLIFHIVFDGVIALFQIVGVPLLITELWVAFAGLISLVFILKSKDMFYRTY